MPHSSRISLFLLSAIHFLHPTSALDPSRLIYAFPKGTWVENSATRYDGSILTTLITKPDIYLFDPRAPHPTPFLVHSFSDSELSSVVGITESSPDTFQVVVSNVTLATLTTAAGSNHIYSITFPHGFIYEQGTAVTVDVKFTASLPDANVLNGLTTLNNNTILAADSRQGVIYAINTITGAYNIAISDPLLVGNGPTAFGVNGIKIRGCYLYFTNTAESLFAKVEIDLVTGTAKGAAIVVARLPNGLEYDDFNLDIQGNAYMAVRSGNEISLISARIGKQRIIAGMVNGTEFVQPTSVSFGKGVGEENWAYITTGGGSLIGVDVGPH